MPLDMNLSNPLLAFYPLGAYRFCMTVVIAGATGLTGSTLIQVLLSDPDVYKVISVGRRSLAIHSSKLQEVMVQDLSEILQVAPLLVGDIFYCCLGTTIKKAGDQESFRRIDYQAVLDFAHVALKNKAKKFVVISALGANSQSSFFYNRVKGEMEEDLQALGLASLIIFRPALLKGPREEFRLGEKIADKLLSAVGSILPQRVTRRLVTDVRRLAEAMKVEAHQSPEAAPKLRFIEAPEI